jgi:hypothetical protein
MEQSGEGLQRMMIDCLRPESSMSLSTVLSHLFLSVIHGLAPSLSLPWGILIGGFGGPPFSRDE